MQKTFVFFQKFVMIIFRSDNSIIARDGLLTS